jgi:hypothetical protein
MKDSIKNPETTRFSQRNLSARGFFKEDRTRTRDKSVSCALNQVPLVLANSSKHVILTAPFPTPSVIERDEQGPSGTALQPRSR